MTNALSLPKNQRVVLTITRSVFRAKPASDPDNQADHQNQAKSAAADGRTAEIKPAAAAQEKQNQ